MNLTKLNPSLTVNRFECENYKVKPPSKQENFCQKWSSSPYCSYTVEPNYRSFQA